MNNIGILVNDGIGNQMFKIFAAISYYIDNSQNYVLYTTNDNGYRKYYWDTLFSNISHKTSDKIDITEKYVAPYFHYKEIPIYTSDVLLEGYFQSPKYFEHNINKIRRIIGIDEHINTVLTKYPEYTIKNTITIHYRMGDYFNLLPWHPVQKPQYYIEAFKTLVSKGVDIYDYEIIYFCEANDNDIVNKYNLEINNALKELYGKDLQFKKVSDDIPDWKQLLIMTSSKHYIIGNSTFSWFGAYLSSSINPVICYPNEWLGEKYKETITDDLFPDSWNRIYVEAVGAAEAAEADNVSDRINNIRIS
jgi:hypothetical protein